MLYNGNCIDIMKTLEDKSIDLICCDLPFGITAAEWDKEIPMDLLWQEYNRLLKDNGTVLLFANGIFTAHVLSSNLKDYKYRWVWVKKNSTNFVHAKNRPMTKSEDILVFSKGAMGHISQLGDKRMTYNPQGLITVNKIRKDGKSNFTNTLAGKRPSHKDEFLVEYTNYPCDVLTDFPEVTPNKKRHTNEKPIELLSYLIRTYSNEGETVLDNCMGSGSCGIACKETNRNFIGIELNEEYFNKAKEWIESYKKNARKTLF